MTIQLPIRTAGTFPSPNHSRRLTGFSNVTLRCATHDPLIALPSEIKGHDARTSKMVKCVLSHETEPQSFAKRGAQVSR